MAKKTTTKKPTKPSAAANATISSIVAGLNKKYGEGKIARISECTLHDADEHMIPTGSIGLNLALGPTRRDAKGVWKAGFPPGVVELFGQESSGKTTIALMTIANAQALGFNVAFIDAEHSIDADYAQSLGVDIDNMYYVRPGTSGGGGSAEEALAIAETLILSRQFQLVVIDSVAALATAAEMEGDIDKSHMSPLARLLPMFFKKIVGHLPASGTTLLMINQVREKVGIVYGNPEVTPGGRAFKFYATFRIEVKRRALITVNDTVVGQQVAIKVIKNKRAPPHRSAEFPFIYANGTSPPGVDTCQELVELAKRYGVLSMNGSWITLGDQKFQGADQFAQAIRQDGRLGYQIYDSVLTRHMASLGYNPDGSRIISPDTTTSQVMAERFSPSAWTQPEDVNGEDQAEDEQAPS